MERCIANFEPGRSTVPDTGIAGVTRVASQGHWKTGLGVLREAYAVSSYPDRRLLVGVSTGLWWRPASAACQLVRHSAPMG